MLHRPGATLLARRQTRVAHHLALRARQALLREVARAGSAPPLPAPGDTIVAGFYVVWRASAGLQSLDANADRLTHVFPEWLHLDASGGALSFRDWDPVLTPQNLAVVQVAKRHGLDIIPILNNADSGRFDPERAHRLLTSPTRQRMVIDTLLAFIQAHQFNGVNVDFENLRPEDYGRMPAFLDLLQARIGARGLAISVDIEARLDTGVVRRIAQSADYALLMAYAQHGPANAPGPLSAVGWYDSVLARLGPVIGPAKLVVGIGNYGIDWRADTLGVPISFGRALVAARTQRSDEPPDSVVDFDDQFLNPTFVYQDTATGQSHQVWFLDAVTARNQLMLAARQHARGTALWVLGAEDPSLWQVYGRGRRPLASAAVLDSIPPPYLIEPEGEGEILSIASLPRAGRRRIDLDSASGLITDETYTSYPSSFVLMHRGYHKGLLALTFDDGPDDRYTPQILDELDSLGVPGTFFVIGRNVERYPNVVRRIFADGDEIGNHTFTHPNVALISRRRLELELNATQRAIQAAIGRSTTLFRVPYNTDAEPQTSAEAAPLLTAASLGYVTVGEQLDPQDWNLYRTDATAKRERRGTADLVASILRQARTIKGNVILLHSAGGDRSHTVEALDIVVPLLRREGYRFVHVSDLLGTTRDSVMPGVRARDQVLVGVDRVTFEAMDAIETALALGFLVAIALVLGRVAFVVTLALVGRRSERRRTFDPTYRPRVAVLIAAYNEAPVIVGTVRSMLASDYPDLTVTVVDDGSTDGTGEVVAAAFAGDGRVRLIRQANTGKAGALNRALHETDAEIVACFDADTQVAPDTIGALARHFADPTVAAVAGNVKVGNRTTTLTIWQSLEYITSQNLDRRAYAYLNAVTVVPGAVGAWRRSAMLEAGGYRSDTLAEDMDLTWRLRRAGWRITVEAEAVAWTEAPETWQAFLRQRQRWAFGSLQVLWKHRGALLRHGWFGWVVVPTVWLFQVLFQFLGPLVDLRLLYAALAFVWSAVTTAALNGDWQPLPQLARTLAATGFFYAVFYVVELFAAVVAFRLDRERMRELWWLFWQRFVYRQTLYYVLWQAMVSALKGRRRAWGKLQRTGTVHMAKA
jgi:cellulose synthase/poly-beta-1,6-N-acetylglucosamine synthase-like glycosyltransferase/peptidoglycan/xylan/chitin deacetylase (PgdA/CDA1 family)/spore germination protein YaaH